MTFHEGWIPEVLDSLEERRYRFVHLDLDMYEPTYACLEYFYPRLVEGGVIVLDDYGFLDWPGCKAATDKWCEEHNQAAVLLPTPNAVIVKSGRSRLDS